jgi:hypothetical protein
MGYITYNSEYNRIIFIIFYFKHDNFRFWEQEDFMLNSVFHSLPLVED